tara:strand:- start:8843 stop:9220 length:378 start_codon:yes stop_codon:yes gene_type:complete
MRVTTPSANYTNLLEQGAYRLRINSIEYMNPELNYTMQNDLHQVVSFFEDPDHGDESEVWIAFPEFKLAFLSSFYETNDMTAKVRDIYTIAELEEKEIDGDVDMAYVPRLVTCNNGVELKLKFEV